MRQIEPLDLPPPRNVFEAIGRQLREYCSSVGLTLMILGEALFFGFRLPRRRAEFGRQLLNCSIKSLFITSVVALFTGMILSLQSGLILKDYNQEVQVGTLVLKTMIREMGPFMTALILASSVGSSYAAEIGTMNVSEEVSALKVMAINPVDFLVMPRLFAMVIMCPALTVYTNVLGTMGGMLVAKTQLDVSPQAYYDNAISSLSAGELHKGLIKAAIFAFIIVGVSAYQGLTCKNGAVGVGVATRKTVVISFLYILMVGYFITSIFYN